jgi:hypothetical protein
MGTDTGGAITAVAAITTVGTAVAATTMVGVIGGEQRKRERLPQSADSFIETLSARRINSEVRTSPIFFQGKQQ